MCLYKTLEPGPRILHLATILGNGGEVRVLNLGQSDLKSCILLLFTTWLMKVVSETMTGTVELERVRQESCWKEWCLEEEEEEE